MKNMLRFVLPAVMLGSLAACASNGGNQLARQDRSMVVDAAYVARVEALARQRGVEVHWVNPPRVIDRRPSGG